MSCQFHQSTAGADCFSGHGLLERGLDPHQGTEAGRRQRVRAQRTWDAISVQVLWRLVQSDMIMHSLHQEPESQTLASHLA